MRTALRLVTRAQPWIVGLFITQWVLGVLVIVQAVALASLVVAVVEGEPWLTPATVLVAGGAARWLAGVGSEWCAQRAATAASEQLRELLLARRLATSPDSENAGAWTVLASSGVASTEAYFTRYLPAVGAATTLPLAAVATIAWWDWPSALIVLATLPLLPLFGALIGLATRAKASHQLAALQSLGGHFLDVVRGLPVLVAYGRADAQISRVSAITHAYRRASEQTLRLAFASSTALEVVATLSVALVAVSAGLRLADGSLSFLTALTVLLLAPEAYWPLRHVGAEYHAAAQGESVLDAVHQVGAHPEVPTPHTVRAPQTSVVATNLSVSRGEEAVLRGLHLSLTGPGLVAITGPSGCGKSTLLEVMRGTLAPQEGTLRVSCPGPSRPYAERVAWGSQHPWVFAGSVADNLRVGRPDATDGELWAILRQLSLSSLVGSLPGGLSGRIHPAQLSAGERARLATARLALSRRPIIVADEPSAFLDPESERLVVDTLRDLARESLVIVVTHRQEVTDAADQVVAWPLPPAPARPSVSTDPEPALAHPRSPVDVPPEAEPRKWWRSYPVATGLAAGASASGLALTATSGWLIATASTHPPVLTLMVAIVGVRLFGLARPALRYAERISSHDAALRELAERRTRVFAHLTRLAPAALPLTDGDLLTRVVEDVDAVLDERLRVRQPLVSGALVAAGAVALGFVIAVEVGLVLAAMVAVAAFAALLAGRASARRSAAEATARADVVTTLEASARDAAHWHAWQLDQERQSELQRTGRVWSAVRRAIGVRVGLARHSVHLVTALAVISVALVLPPETSGASQALSLVLVVALGELVGPWCGAAALHATVRASARRLESLLALTPAVPDTTSAPTRTPIAPDATYRLHDVTLRRGERPILTHLDAAVGPHETVVVTGPSGSGKTTLTWLLARYLVADSGTVTLDDSDLRELGVADVRGRVAWVSDNPHLFATSVIENVRLARPEADDDEVIDALTDVGLLPWLATLDNGGRTVIGQGHRDVSGGQRARLALARAVLSQRPVWVLDEPTAHLDAPSAAQVHALVDDRTGHHSVVWVSHDLPRLRHQPRVVRLEGGRLHVVTEHHPVGRRSITA